MEINKFYNSDRLIMVIIITKDNIYTEVDKNDDDIHMDLIKRIYKKISLAKYTRLCLYSDWYDIFNRITKDGNIVIKLTNMQDIYQIVYLPEILNNYQLMLLRKIYNNNYRKYYYLNVLDGEIDLRELFENVENFDEVNVSEVLHKKTK